MGANKKLTEAEACERFSKSGPFLVGEWIYLRPLEPADVTEAYVGWLNDSDVTRFMQTGAFPTMRHSLRQYVKRLGKSSDTVMLAMVERGTGRHVGNVKLGPIHQIHHRADLGIMIGEKTRWGRGYGREAVGLMLGYAFERLNLHKVTLGVEAGHKPAVRLYEELGFKIEGVQRQHIFRNGRYRDNLVMGLLRSEYRKNWRQTRDVLG